MSEPQLSSPRKRRTEHYPPSPPLSLKKRQKQHHSGYIDTPEFWDSLSKIWLTKHALREFDRRNNRRSPNRPTTRSILAEQRPATDFTHNSGPDIKRFARHGGPDLSDLVGYPEPISPNHEMSLSRSNSCPSRGSSTSRRPTETTTKSGKSKSTKTSNPHDNNYQQKLIDGRIFPYGYEYQDGSVPALPPNWEETNKRLAQPRPSLSPSRFPDPKFQEFIKKDARAFNEDAVKDTVLPTMLDAIGASRGAEKNILFTNLDPIAEGIAQAKPDYYYGARPEQIDPQVRDELDSVIIPSTHTHLPAVPNFFLEAKGPDGSAAVARRQACHVGAIGARAMQRLQSYGQDGLTYDNKAYTFSSTYHEGTLKIYGHSVGQPKGPGTRPEYYMHQLNTWGLTGNRDTFLQGATAFKNTIDLVEEYRNAAIARANERVAQTIEDESGDENNDKSYEHEEGEEEEVEEEEKEVEEQEEEEEFRTPPDTPQPESSGEDTRKRHRDSLLSSPSQTKRHNPGSFNLRQDHPNPQDSHSNLAISP